MGTPPQPGQVGALAGTAGGGSHALLCQRRGAQGLPCFAGCCGRLHSLTTRFALYLGAEGGGGCRGSVAHLRRSQDNSEHGGLCCSLRGSYIPLRDPHQVGGSPPIIHGPAEPGKGLGGFGGFPSRQTAHVWNPCSFPCCDHSVAPAPFVFLLRSHPRGGGDGGRRGALSCSGNGTQGLGRREKGFCQRKSISREK